MIRRIFARLFPCAKRRRFAAWQIELTTRCPLLCKMCLRDAATRWHTRDMPIEDFKKLLPYLGDVETAVLEGWGEPLLYRDLPRVVRLVKEASCRAGFVTSGWGLDDDRIMELIDAGVDFIGFSLAGATPGTHNVIRANSNLHSLLRSIQAFQEFKAKRKITHPRLHIVFLVLRDNLAELPLLVECAKEIGIDEIVVINLIQVSNAWQDAQKVFTCGENEGHAVFMEAASKAKALKIRLRMASFAPREVGVCAENPLRNLYISVDGNVSPCVYLYPPIPSPWTRIYCGREHPAGKVSFGNVFEESFENIWNREAYREFRMSFEERQKNFDAGHPGLVTDPEPVYGNRAVALAPPPETCRNCHKMLGV